MKKGHVIIIRENEGYDYNSAYMYRLDDFRADVNFKSSNKLIERIEGRYVFKEKTFHANDGRIFEVCGDWSVGQL